MADPARPKAPFLPPEIVTQIIDSTPSKSYPLIARINSSWTTEAQIQLFSQLDLSDVDQLRLIVPILESIESQDRLAKLVNSVWLHLCRLDKDEEPAQNGTPEEADLIFRLLSSTTNLKTLRFGGPSYTFSPEHQAKFFSKPVLPSLLTLELLPAGSARFAPISNYSAFECILASSPAIESLTIETFSQFFRGVVDFEPNWSARSYPKNLKNFKINSWEKFAEGKIWPLESMVGLESFAVSCALRAESRDIGLFFKTVGPTLKVLNLQQMNPSLMLNANWSDLEVLERLEHIKLERNQPRILLELPATLKFFSASGANGAFDEMLKVYQDHSAQIHSLNYFQLKIMDMHPEQVEEVMKLGDIPTTKSFCGYYACADEFDTFFKRSLNALKVGEAKFEEIVLKKEEFEDGEIKKRCEELGIKLSCHASGWLAN